MGSANETEHTFYDAAILSEAKTKRDVISFLAKDLFEKGYVNEDYCKATLEREDNYPTGLATKPIGIAVPHSNPENVLKEAIVVAIIPKAVKFAEMGNNASLIDVGIVFMLALKGENNHLNYLKNIVNYFKQQENVLSFHALRSKTQMKSILLQDILKVQQ
ncbi:PTS sugar transporter subunit IIA [Pectinatus haikarae]|uniref:PTS system galactitol-specific IIA component n=1 Tax=Pectinatus haikarae TaxID=349096 RepID=A0ABT9Y939_9FIRM|nr:PTS sugar transporter subunit IIA [Pectinatus haikarae]MDQ0203697.1 PTS system galactitol-specific IIA component [Pectinatus haikarae]